MASKRPELTHGQSQEDELHRRKTERTTRSQRGTIRLRHEKAVNLAYTTHAQRRVSRTHLAQESIRAHQARIESNKGFTLQRLEWQREQQQALAKQRQTQAGQSYWQSQTRQGVNQAIVQPAAAPIKATSGNIAGGIVRALVIIVGLSMLYLVVSNGKTYAGVLGKVQSALTTFTQTTPLIKI